MLIFGAALAFAFLNVKRAPKRQLSNNLQLRFQSKPSAASDSVQIAANKLKVSFLVVKSKARRTTKLLSFAFSLKGLFKYRKDFY